MAEGREHTRFELLGPVRAFRSGQRLALGWPGQQAVLVTLLLSAGHVVSRDELVDAVWGPEPPPTAANVVHSYVARLRKVLEPERARRAPGRLLISSRPGYLLNLETDQLDLRVAEQKLGWARRARAEGDLRASVAAFDDALGMWRGTPLTGVAGPLAEIERTRLVELRLGAMEDRAEALLGLGEGEGLASQLLALAAEHPFRERLAGLVLRALDQSRRRADALAFYRRTRRQLVDELGVEPGPDLQRLHEDILGNRGQVKGSASASGSSAARTAPAGGAVRGRLALRQLPLRPRHFVGRVAELTVMARMANEAIGPPGGAVILAISGTPGVGKTALAVHFAHQAAEQFTDGQLYVDLHGVGATAPVRPQDAIGGFLAALGMAPEHIPPSLDLRATLYRSLLAGKRALVVLDNARDEDQVRPLLPGIGNCLVIVTSRSKLVGLVAVQDASLITLGTLSGTEACELLARRLGAERAAAEPQTIGQLAGLCSGLPLALGIAAARAATRPHLPLTSVLRELHEAHSRLDALDAGEPASSIRAAFSWSYRTLSGPAARMFRLLGSYPEPHLTIPAAASLAGISARQARVAVAELARAHLLNEHDHGQFTCHDLLLAYAAELAAADLSPQCIGRMRRQPDAAPPTCAEAQAVGRHDRTVRHLHHPAPAR